MAVPPETLNEEKSQKSTKQTVWATLPQPVQSELVQALSLLLIAALLPPGKEESDD